MNESVYTCAICGKEHNSILSRAKCEIECANRAEEEAKKAAEAKKQAEYNARVEEVNKAFDHAYKLRDNLSRIMVILMFTTIISLQRTILTPYSVGF